MEEVVWGWYVPVWMDGKKYGKNNHRITAEIIAVVVVVSKLLTLLIFNEINYRTHQEHAPPEHRTQPSRTRTVGSCETSLYLTGRTMMGLLLLTVLFADE